MFDPPTPGTIPPTRRPRLLVSVRNACEAEAALAGGAEIIDVKEPRNGPLGRAERRAVDRVIEAVAGSVPVTAAAGELDDLTPTSLQDWLPPAGLELVKVGLAGAGPDWRRRWGELVAAVGQPERCVPVAYADWQAAAAPSPAEAAAAAVESGCRWLLVDTFCKTAGGLLGHWSAAEIARRLADWRRLGLRVALAGRLSENDLSTLAPLAPEVLGVRGAACTAGRSSAICASKVRRLRAACQPPAEGAAAIDRFAAKKI